MTATSTKPLSELLAQTEFSDDDIVRLLGLTDPEECEALRQRAFDVTTEKTGNNVYLRGLIEVSNICTANCRYCGIRKDNHTVERYTLTEESIVACALHALKEGYGSIAIQAGERRDRSGSPGSPDFWSAFTRKRSARSFPRVSASR